jgi:hypothetical protein
MLSAVDADWIDFLHGTYVPTKDHKQCPTIPTFSEIYISTQTKIAFLTTPIDLAGFFWNIDIIPYNCELEGVIKKQMKINCINESEVYALESKIQKTKQVITVNVISQINNPDARCVKFKDTRKVNIGLCKKDLITYRVKKKGAFYNCFVLILRLLYKGCFKETHVKVFNTGKLEIPGIQETEYLYKVLDLLIYILNNHSPNKTNPEILYNKKDISTVLINSNFTCNYFIDRDKLSEILKYKYFIHIIYDPCSYPGIQCKFYYNTIHSDQNGICQCSRKCSKKGSGNGENQCLEISFMIFRTGSVLIVGNCDEEILMIIYRFVKRVLIDEYVDIYIPGCKQTKKKSKISWKKNVLITNKNYVD